MAYKAIIAGASGLIGSNLLNLLLAEPLYNEVLVIVRKELPQRHKKLVQLVIDFDNLQQHSEAITGHALFCCLGTTQRQTPDLATYHKIDHDYPVLLAQLARQNGVKQYHLVSSLGANAGASNFYLKTKGEVERDVERVGLDTLHIYEPAMLIGNRTEPRLVDKLLGGLFKIIDPLLIGGLKKYRSIKATVVAAVMLKKSLQPGKGVFIHTSDKIQTI